MQIDLNRIARPLWDLNDTIRKTCIPEKQEYRYAYHMEHIRLVINYAIEINKRLGLPDNSVRYTYIGLGHDLLKEHGLDEKYDLHWNNIKIPMNLNYYVRKNLDILEKFQLDDYFNSDCSLHGLAAGIFMYKEMGIHDECILYPIFFHSCPIMEVYHKLPQYLQNMIDVILLADKLSSNWLRINMLEKDVCCDMDLAVFGPTGKEFNYSIGLVLARLISQSKWDGEQSTLATNEYIRRLNELNPAITKIELGGKQKWPKRNLRLKTWLRPFGK